MSKQSPAVQDEVSALSTLQAQAELLSLLAFKAKFAESYLDYTEILEKKFKM